MQFAKKLFYTLRSVGQHPLKREAPVRAAVKFCLAQVAVRFVPGDIGVAFPNQTRLLISPQMKGAAHFISPGLCEFEEMCFVAHFLRPGDLFADVGANVGAFTLLASGVAGARTVAFEPSPPTFRYLLANVRLNDLSDRVIAHNLALGGKEGVVRFTENLGTENYVCPNGAEPGGIEVKVTSLDRIFADRAPTLIKMDVEGFETEVFAGAAKLLADPALEAMIVERGGSGERYGHDEGALHERIRAAGFVPCAYSALKRDLTRTSAEGVGNVIYVRRLEEVQKRVRTATAFRFAGREI